MQAGGFVFLESHPARLLVHLRFEFFNLLRQLENGNRARAARRLTSYGVSS